MAESRALSPADLEVVGRYRLEGRLGTGGQGVVYVGRADEGARVAVKLLHPHLISDERAQARFPGEVEVAKRVALITVRALAGAWTSGGGFPRPRRWRSSARF
ncbi:hypothetical protein ACFQ07_28625 [Actinomadura adrarensis]|uniref:Protein kinase domain-containing protein n=1 Tax=Actinomadura adrarensis TaxID=1819600 RepID=A0ABW3CPB5_9ACTN